MPEKKITQLPVPKYKPGEEIWVVLETASSYSKPATIKISKTNILSFAYTWEGEIVYETKISGALIYEEEIYKSEEDAENFLIEQINNY